MFTRVAWYPMGLYEQQKARERSRRICYSLLIFCTMAGAAALTVSWLLATGRIDPDRFIPFLILLVLNFTPLTPIFKLYYCLVLGDLTDLTFVFISGGHWSIRCRENQISTPTANIQKLYHKKNYPRKRIFLLFRMLSQRLRELLKKFQI